MIADGFHDGVDAAVAHAETFAGHAADISLAAGRAIERHVAGDDVFLRHERRTGGRKHNDFAAGKSFAEIIVRIAFENQRHAFGHERAETLAGEPLK